MVAITARLLHLRSIPRLNPYTLHYFSSSSSPDPPFDTDPQPQPQPQSEQEPESKPKTPSPFSSYFTDVKASLQREPTVKNHLRRPQPFFNPTPSPQTPTSPSQLASMDDIRRNLSEFRIRSAPPPPPSASSGQTVSLQELYKRNVIPNSNNFTPSPTVTSPNFTVLSESIRQMRAGDQTGRNQFAHLKENLNQKSDPNTHLDPTMVVGGAHTDKKENGNDGAGSAAMRNAFYKSYDKPELGMKLKKLRPDKRKGNWFSLQELNERLARLREVEEKEETQKGIGGLDFRYLRHSLEKLKATQDENKNQKIKQKLNVLSHLGGTPSFMLSPPKEHLVEQYFHPDNMSSAKKLKLELKKVREEFKMSETDCGSARVQVAQLTTKIKHLSIVLAKKDKHSRKGLLAMVQRRKKLLKYLRRTDFDSYSLVLSKLGLRDNPDIKA